MSLVVNMMPSEIYGEQTEPLSGRYVIADCYAAILGKEKTVTGDDGKEQTRAPKTFGIVVWKDVETGSEYENRYPMGFSDRFVPGEDLENYAKAKAGEDRIRGQFVLRGKKYQDKEVHLQVSQYDSWPKLLLSLQKAGVPPERFEKMQTEGLAAAFVGVSVVLYPEQEEYEDRRGEKQKALINLATERTFEEAGDGGSKSEKKANAKTEPKAKAEKADSGDEDEAKEQLLNALVEKAMEELTEGNEVTRVKLSTKVPSLNKDLGDLVAKGPKGIFAVANAVKGKGDLAGKFDELLEANGLTADKDGNITIAE